MAEPSESLVVTLSRFLLPRIPWIPLQNAKINAALAGFWCAFGLCTGASTIFYRAGLRGAECCIVRYSRAAVVEPYDEHDPCEPPR